MSLSTVYYRTIYNLKFHLKIHRLTPKLIFRGIVKRYLDIQKRTEKVYILFKDEEAIAFSRYFKQLRYYQNKKNIEGNIKSKMVSRGGILGLDTLLKRV